jgi:hypothetical protein
MKIISNSEMSSGGGMNELPWGMDGEDADQFRYAGSTGLSGSDIRSAGMEQQVLL